MSIKRLIALILTGGLIILLTLQINGMPDIYQYLALSPREMPAAAGDKLQADDHAEISDSAQPAKETDSELKSLLKVLSKRLEEGTLPLAGAAVTASTPEVALTLPNGQSAGTQLLGLWGDEHIKKPQVLRFGRLLYREELDTGSRTAVLDEQLAITLFRVSDPVGRTFMINDVSFTVVGVIRHARAVGDQAPHSVYVPLLTLDELGLQTGLLTVSLLPKGGSGAFSALESEMQRWLPGGTLYSLQKESYRALLPLRYLLCLLGILLLGQTFRLSVKLAKHRYASFRTALQSRYATQLLPTTLLNILTSLLLLALQLAFAYLLFSQIIAPVYVFPEWVPSILVEWKEITATFWNNINANASPISLRTPETLALTFYRSVLTAAILVFGVLLLMPWRKRNS